MSDSEDKPKNLLSYHSKLVGVTFEGRQDVIKVLNGTEPLRVRREPENKYDPRAVAVDVKFGEDWAPIGYIAKDKNEEIAASLDAGNEAYIAIASITGGDKKSFGVNIKLEYLKVEPAEKIAKAAELVEERELSAKDKLQLAVYEFIAENSGGSVTKSYTSRLIGKSTEVTVTDGHVSLPGYMSGSAFPDRFYDKFNEDEMIDKIIEKHFSDSDKKEDIKHSILAMWNLNREASTGYGTAIHAALENYDTYHRLGDKTKTVKVLKTKTNVGPNKALSKNPFLKKIVEDFHELFGGDYVRLNEQFVWHHEKKLAGAIDRVKVVDVDKRIVRIQDFKTDGNIHDKKYQLKDSPFWELTQGETPEMGKELLDLHWLQLSFYAYILAQYGYTVEGLDIYWLNPSKLIKGENPWEEFSHKVIDISKGL